ncbi:MAG TPA: SDR family NAD(P)-dependent oxidoreductase, partial [Jatrophihabitans sp.]|nr:SDR family NAD(P)-dependent oxidoreductase [Jatrophihabitans sp.]
MTRTVVITGASAGVGRASAAAFGARGDRVVLLARGEQGLAGAARDVREAGGTPYPYPVDMADADAVFAVAEQTERDVGPIDVWVNDAFTSVFAPFEAMTAE